MKLRNILEVYTNRTSQLNQYMRTNKTEQDAFIDDLQEIDTLGSFIKCVLFSLDHAFDEDELNANELVAIVDFLIDRDDDVGEIIHNSLMDLDSSYDGTGDHDDIMKVLRTIGSDSFYKLFLDIRHHLDAPNIFSNNFWYTKLPLKIAKKLLFAWHSLQADGVAYGHTKTTMRLIQSKVLPPNTWVVHFSRNAKDVAENGFKFGTPTKHNLSLTTMLSKSYKTGGYNFGFLADGTTAKEYTDQHNSHYGKDFVMFQSAGSLFFHKTDHEEQFVFDGAALDNKNFVYVRHQHPKDHNDEDGPVKRFQVLNYHTGKPIYIGDYVAVVRWIKDNYNQRKGDICPAEAAAITKQQQVSKPKG